MTKSILIRIINLFVFIVNILLLDVDKSMAQETITDDRLFRSWTILNNQADPIKGYLYSTYDAGFMLLPYHAEAEGKQGNIKVPYFDVVQLKIRRKGSVGKGLLIGAVAGCAAGILVGLATYQKSDGWDLGPGVNAIAGAFFGTPVGLGVGAAIGSSKRIIPISSDPNHYIENGQLLREYVITTSGKIE